MSKVYNAKDAISILKQKGIGRYRCAFCGSPNFSIQDQVANINIGTELGHLELGNHIPAAIMVCTNCGNLQFFALGMLGMLNSKGGDKE